MLHRYIHSLGIYHLDLTPSNVLLTHSFRAEIADFGTAKDEEEIDVDKATVTSGTNDFMLPEAFHLSTLNRNAISATIHQFVLLWLSSSIRIYYTLNYIYIKCMYCARLILYVDTYNTMCMLADTYNIHTE